MEKPGMIPTMIARVLLAVGVVVVAASPAGATPKKKYHFELTAVMTKPEVKPDVGKAAAPRIEAQVKKAFESHPQLVAKLDDAPDPKNQDAYRGYLTRKGLDGSYLVTVEVTDASEELTPLEDKPGSQRLVIKLALHMLGENIPGRTMAFTGDGHATVKLEVGKKVRDRDREYSWDQAAEVAVHDAIETSLKQLARPKAKP
jgi:hypothetical protein